MRPLKVIVFDDMLSVREVVVRVIEMLGHEVLDLNFSSPLHEMISCLSGGVQDPDLVITDFNMGTFKGDEVVRFFKNFSDNKIKVVIMSGGSDIEKARIATGESDADAFLKKPISITELQAVIAHLFPE